MVVSDISWVRLCVSLLRRKGAQSALENLRLDTKKATISGSLEVERKTGVMVNNLLLEFWFYI